MARDEQRSQRGQPERARDGTSAPAAGSGHEKATAPGLLPTIALPKGGGAIRGMGEKFAANPVSGTGSMSVPIPTSPGRAGFGPALALWYDSGAGNGAFGFGWRLAIPAITRKTDKGLPHYRDADESDVYVLSGSEDLVPVIGPAGLRHRDDTSAPGYVIHRYRPRIEGLFARIERWTETATGDIHWRSISRDNITTLYGRDDNSRIFDPADPRRVFSWLVCASHDDKGNAAVYEYAAEDDAHVDRMLASERHRVPTANRYVKRIRYGNRVSRLVEPDLTQAQWMFEVVFDYDEGHYEELALDPLQPEAEQHQRCLASTLTDGSWAVRPDPFSSYRSGFEVRTYRRCRRVLSFHRFEELGAEPCLVRSTEFHYADLDYLQPVAIEAELAHPGSTRIASVLRSVTQAGYVRDAAAPVVERDGVAYLTYVKKALPPLAFEYSKARIQSEVRELDASSLESLPHGLDGATYQWVDLDGEGVSGMLTRQAGAWSYKPNLGDATFGPAQVLRTQPSLFARTGGGEQLLDLSGDGRLDVVAFGGPTPGFYERTPDDGWDPFRALPRLPNVRWDDPNLRFLDLDGDGHADILITQDDVHTWYPSLAEAGFGPARHVRTPADDEHGPRLVLADAEHSIYLADLCGDGLTDLVRIRNGEICYWPNLGHGRFGAKVTMDHAPWFDRADQFDQRRLRLADIDGSGATDLLYLGRDGVRIYFNQAGNRWSDAYRLTGFPQLDDLSSVTTADLLGNGTACLVWSSPLPGDARRPLRYIDLMGGQKPHLLTKTVNNLGAETHVEYAPSTKFYLADKRAGKPWITRLPFPVHVVERVTTHDHISGNRFASRYAYHHGYFDGVERELRGFGMVEQWDTEEFAALTGDGTLPEPTNVDAASHVPPVLTRTWFHTGIYIGRDHVSDYFAGLGNADGEYYREPGLTEAEAAARLLPDTILPAGLTLDEEREACRALKGMMLRQEIYALDGTARAATPYTVSEQNFTIERLQSRGGNRHAVFFTHPREAINYHYERNPADPRISHAMTLEVDSWGNALEVLAIGYGRRTVATDPMLTAEDKAKQARLSIAYSESAFTNPIDDPHSYRAPLIAEARTYEMTGFSPSQGAERFRFDDWTDNGSALLGSAIAIPYEQTADDVTPQKRLIEHTRSRYRADDLGALLPVGELEPMALPGESYKLALTPGLVAQVFVRESNGQPEPLVPDPAAVLEGQGADRGGYVAWDGGWWIPSGRVYFDPDADLANPAVTAAAELATARAHFYAPRKAVDAFGHSSVVSYDAFDLLVTGASDAVGNVATAVHDYRVLAPRLVTDPNLNRTAAAFDALGLVVAIAVMGKEGELAGDLLTGFDADLTLAVVQAFVADPRAQAASLLGNATSRIVYDVARYMRAGQPQVAAMLVRETHVHDSGGAATKIQIGFSYSDGFERAIQSKLQAEVGEAPTRQTPIALPAGDLQPGDLIRDAQDKLVVASVPQRWVGSGRTVFNNKGKPVRQYEPFFSATHLYEPERDLTDTGVSAVVFYDPVGRAVATLHPDHTYAKVVFDPWRQVTYDGNDTAAAHGAETGDPRIDADIAGYVAAYFGFQPPGWQTWLAQRISGQLGAAEQAAAQQAAAHADTPAIVHLDALGRPFVTVAHNRYEVGGLVVEDRHASRVELDIEGNQRAVIDALGRVVMRYDHDLLGGQLHQISMDAGERWMLNDIAGKPIRAWDNRGFARRMTYDPLRRPSDLYVASGGLERLAGRTIYGEVQGDALNHRTRAYQRFDGAGVVTSLAYDFKGNLLERRRDLVPDYKQAVDWLASPAADDGSFTTSTIYDALNRPLAITSPDGSVYRATFNDANLLDHVEVTLRGAVTATPFVENIDYDAKGQRRRIAYGAGVSAQARIATDYEYDPLTYRLRRLRTLRPGDGAVLQDLDYTYDPVGNVTEIFDAAQQTIYHDNAVAEARNRYTYDALYRLIAATGREHIGQLPQPETTWDDAARVRRPHPNDEAMRLYTERYVYDAVGNFIEMIHQATGGNWTRAYAYAEPSAIEPTKTCNRLSTTTVGSLTTPYLHDVHGNMTAMPHLPVMVWDAEDQLQASARQVVSGGATPETTYYVYDASGARVRKVTERQTASGITPTRKHERIYLGAFEIYREYAGDGGTVTLERETLHVLDDVRRIALVETRTAGDDGSPAQLIRYQLGNHLGSSSVELDAAGAVISYEEYYPYGSTSYQGVRSQTEAPRRYRYTAKERDDETGLSYHGARYYAPWLARWTAADPAGLVDGTNVYRYASGSPVVYTDPSGHASEASVLVKIEAMLQKKGIPYNTEVTVRGRVKVGGEYIWVVRIYDILYKDPDTKQWVGVEAKGDDLSKAYTRDQQLVDKAIADQKPDLKVVSEAGEPNSSHQKTHGRTKVRGIKGLHKGQEIKVAPETSHGRPGYTPSGPAPKTSHVSDTVKQLDKLPDPVPVPKGTPGMTKPGDQYRPATPDELRDATARTKPDKKPYDGPGSVEDVRNKLKKKSTFQFKHSLKSIGGSAAGMGLEFSLGYFRNKNYNEAAELRASYMGEPTDEQIARQKRAGWVYSGQLNDEGRPIWNYKPDVPLRLREAIWGLMNLEMQFGDPHSFTNPNEA